MHRLVYTEEAKSNIEKLPDRKKRQIKQAVERIALNPDAGKRLSGVLRGLYSYRSGYYRIIYRVIHNEIIVLVMTAGHRRDVYEKAVRKFKDLRGFGVNE